MYSHVKFSEAHPDIKIRLDQDLKRIDNDEKNTYVNALKDYINGEKK